MQVSKKQVALMASLGLLFGALLGGQTKTGHAAKVTDPYQIKTTEKITARLRLKPAAAQADSKVYMWSKPYRSSVSAKKIHLMKNYKNRTFVATKQATMNNGLVYYYGHIQNNDKVVGWVYKGALKQSNMAAFGDSITKGWTGVDYATNPYPALIGSAMGINVVNKGENSGKVVGDTNLDLTYNVDHTKLASYDYATVAYGVNDYFKTETIYSVEETLDRELTAMKKANPKLQIFAFLPLDAYVKDKESGQFGLANVTNYTEYTLSDLVDLEKSVYAKHKIPVLDWREYESEIIDTKNGYPCASFGDNRLHPTQETYDKMAKIMETFLDKNMK
ncbi:GDSL family lipase [Secundilactobacillus kimchicus]|uniref:GDSL family lipase n=1 Tax=Secundilactobacillus kimchicus JCM 15530 TaxID=1302272 RepID=A0A0R1I151_9LACO|nr:SGNH/GDSL hydrolase family protein [Secundilactobacillus kimchicus]KRK49466.1 GDSL family lipase [Secundilactobacillus kimchicus JCM 15530]MBT9673013.1 GDSL family lipase [Secundilactobacillus kimchicus]